MRLISAFLLPPETVAQGKAEASGEDRGEAEGAAGDGAQVQRREGERGAGHSQVRFVRVSIPASVSFTAKQSVKRALCSRAPPAGWPRPRRRGPTCTPSRAAAASSPPRRSATSGSRRSSSPWTRPSPTRSGRSLPFTRTWRTLRPTRSATWSSTV